MRLTLLRGIRTVRESRLPVRYELSSVKWDRLLDCLEDANAWIMERDQRIELVATTDDIAVYFPNKNLALEFRLRWL